MIIEAILFNFLYNGVLWMCLTNFIASLYLKQGVFYFLIKNRHEWGLFKNKGVLNK